MTPFVKRTTKHNYSVIGTLYVITMFAPLIPWDLLNLLNGCQCVDHSLPRSWVWLCKTEASEVKLVIRHNGYTYTYLKTNLLLFCNIISTYLCLHTWRWFRKGNIKKKREFSDKWVYLRRKTVTVFWKQSKYSSRIRSCV